MGKSNRIIKGLQLLLILSGIMLLAITCYLGIDYRRKQAAIVPEYEKILTLKGQDYAKKVTDYFSTQEKNAMAFSELPSLPAFINTLKITTKGSQEEKTALQDLTKTIKEFTGQSQSINTFKNIMLTLPDGRIVFSSTQPKYVDINLSTKPDSQTELGYSFMRSAMSIVQDTSTFYFDELILEPAIYTTVPIFTSGKLQGFLIAQIDHNVVYQMSRNYLGLGKTGELVAAERFGDKTQIIAPTRLSPTIAFKKMGLSLPGLNAPLQLAVRGQRGVGFGWDYRQQYILAYWDYLASIDWGFDVKIDAQEILSIHDELAHLLLALIILTLSIWCLIALSFSTVRAMLMTSIQSIHRHISLRLFTSSTALILCILSAGAGGYIYYSLSQSQKQALSDAKSNSERLGTEAIKNIQLHLDKLATLVKGMTSYLNAAQVVKDDVVTNLQRKINEEPRLFAFCVAYADQSFAPYATRKDGKMEILKLEDILTEQTQDHNFMTLPWFKEAMEQKKPVWIQPTPELLTGKLVVTYAEPFFDPEDKDKVRPLGVSAAMYAIDTLKPLLSNLIIGETGYSFIVNKAGKFIYHPRIKYQSDETIFSAAQQTDNTTLNEIDQRIVEGKQGVEPYLDEKTGLVMWVSYQPIPITQWSLAIVFTQREINPPAEHMHHQKIWLIICIVLALLFLCGLLVSLRVAHHPRRDYAIGATAIFIMGILGIWRLVEPNIDVKNGIVIYNSIGLDTYLEELIKNAHQRHEPEPLPLPTGIFVESWAISGSTKADITGTIWQVYNEKNHLNLARSFTLPDATTLYLSNPYSHTQKDETTAGSTINATIAQQFDFSKFPLDSQRIKIMIDHKELNRNVLLVPDLASYESIRPTDLPGLYKGYKYYGFTIQRSFFSLEKTKENTDFGIQAYSGISEHLKLNYNIIVTRDLMNALIVYFMPLLVILISLFAIFAVTGRMGKGDKKKLFVSLGSYTGLLFALVALNVALRTQYPSGNVLYMEYFFFYTYLTILILIVHGAFVQVEAYEQFIDETLTPAMKDLFWPMQLMIWFITTVVVFYT